MTRHVRFVVVLAVLAAVGCSSDAGDLVVTGVADLKPVPFAELREKIAETNRQLVDELADTATTADPDWTGPCGHEPCATEAEDNYGDNAAGEEQWFPYPIDTVIAASDEVKYFRDAVSSDTVTSLSKCAGHVVYLHWAVTGGSPRKGPHYIEQHVDGPEIATRFVEAVGAPVIAQCGAELDPTHWS